MTRLGFITRAIAPVIPKLVERKVKLRPALFMDERIERQGGRKLIDRRCAKRLAVGENDVDAIETKRTALQRLAVHFQCPNAPTEGLGCQERRMA
ncbi:hypothetical protein AZKH_1755 [Azoarcus sp. KH32C]|nr:hypothetical protein AZKH_1755 [Azoarcus sp. KH32C]